MILGMPARRLAPAVVPLKFDPLRKAGSVSLSDSDTKANLASGSTFQTAVGTTGKASGRYAFEVIAETNAQGDYFSGVIDETASPATFSYLGINTNARESFGYWMINNLSAYWAGFNQVSSASKSGGVPRGNVCTVDVDFGASEIKVYDNGTLRYTRSSAPFTQFGTGVFWFPAISLRNAGSRIFIRGSGLAYLPSGSNEWDSP
jgi:hypothetical protein